MRGIQGEMVADVSQRLLAKHSGLRGMGDAKVGRFKTALR
jgi:hypothetical protein